MSYQFQDSIGFHLFRTTFKLKARFARELRPFDITTEQYGVLFLLWDLDGLQQWEIADLLLKDRPNVTRILEKLEKKKLIARKVDANDRRATRVFLTPAGREIKPHLEQAVERIREQSYQGLSQRERTELRNVLNRIMENLNT
jgi:DNA-binding MarR family transcriptional regulator